MNQSRLLQGSERFTRIEGNFPFGSVHAELIPSMYGDQGLSTHRRVMGEFLIKPFSTAAADDITVTGTLGVLRVAAELRLIDVNAVVQSLRATNFYVDDNLIRLVFGKWLG